MRQGVAPADPARLLRLAARAMARAGLVHAYGHVSSRLDADRFLVSPAKPLGSVAPGETCTEMPTKGPLPDGVLGEVRIHQQIYARRADVGGIVRIQPPAAMALSVCRIVPRPLHGLGSYFTGGIPLWDDPALLRDDARAAELAALLGDARAIVLRGNGAVCVGGTIEQAAAHAFFLEDAARLELAVRAMPGAVPVPYTPEQAAARAVMTGGLYERMWDHLTAGDPEAGGSGGAS